MGLRSNLLRPHSVQQTTCSVDVTQFTLNSIDKLKAWSETLQDTFYRPRCDAIVSDLSETFLSQVGFEDTMDRESAYPLSILGKNGWYLDYLVQQNDMSPWEVPNFVSLLMHLATDTGDLTWGRLAPLVGRWNAWNTIGISDVPVDRSIIIPRFMCQSGIWTSKAFCAFGVDDFQAIQNDLLLTSTLPICVGEPRLQSCVTRFLTTHTTLLMRDVLECPDALGVWRERAKCVAFLQYVSLLRFKLVRLYDLTGNDAIKAMACELETLMRKLVAKSEDTVNGST